MKKRLISILLTVLMVMSMFTGMSVSAYADDVIDSSYYKEYTLAEGDYVLRICQRMGINYYTCKEAIMALNNITSENGFRYLSIGETVKIPVSDAAAVAIMTGKPVSGSTGSTGSTGTADVSGSDPIAYYLIPYTMQRGETVLGVCNSLGINFTNNADLIQSVNGIKSWNSVKAGDTVLLPSSKVPAVGTTCYAVLGHKIASGETTYTICQNKGINYGSSTKLLQALNTKTNLSAIKAGNTLYVPVATTIKAASTSSSAGSTNTNTNTNTSTSTGSTTETAKSYDITANINTNYGTMKFYVNNKEVSTAAEGAVVTVDVTTNDGRAVESLVVKHADGRADVQLDANSFIMPACDVRVDANIKSGYDIKINSNYGFKTVAQVGGINVSSASAGSSVKIVSTDPGFAVKEVEAYYTTLFGMKKNVLSVNSQFAFSMPDKDVEVNVTLAPVETYNFYRADTKNGSFDIQVDGNSVSKAAKGAKVTLLWQPANGYEISVISVNKYDAKTGTVGDAVSVYNNSFTMPASDVQIGIIFASSENSIDIEAVEGGELIAQVGGANVSEAKTDAEVTIIGKAKADGYKDSIKELVVTRKADGHRVTVTNNSFRMPAGGVIVSGKLESAEDYSVTVNFSDSGSENRVTLKADGYDNWSVIDTESGDSENYAVGTRISLSTLARDTHAFTKFEVYVGGAFDQEMTDMANDQGMIVMPNKNVAILATFTAGDIAIDPATITGSGVVSYQVNGSSANSCKIGDTVRIIAQPSNIVYQVTKDSIKVVNNQTGKELSLNDNFEFTMPAEGVTVSVSFVGIDVTAYLYVFDSTSGVADPSHLQGKSMVEARIYNGPIPVVDNNTPSTAIAAKSHEAIVIKLTDASKNDYVIDKVEVISHNTGTKYDNGVEEVLDKDKNYRVWMTNCDVDIRVYLKEKTSKTCELSVSYDSSKGTVGCAVGSQDAEVVSSCQVGDVVYVVPKTAAPYYAKPDGLTVTRKSDNNILLLDSNVKAVTNADGHVLYWYFTMPEGGVSMKVDFVTDMYSIKLSVVDTNDTDLLAGGFVQLTVGDKLVDVTGKIDDVSYNSKVAVALTKLGEGKYTIESVTAPNVTISKNSFNMPATKDLDLKVVLKEKVVEPETIKLNYTETANKDQGSLQFYGDDGLKTNLNGSVEVGKDVYIQALPLAGYEVTELTVKNAKDNIDVAPEKVADNVWKFTAPAEGVTISVKYEAIKYTLTIDCEESDNNLVQVSINGAAAQKVSKGNTFTVAYGQKIVFSIADSGYTLKNVYGAVGTEAAKEIKASSNMPAANMSVSFKVAAK